VIEFLIGCAAGWLITYLWFLGKDRTPRTYEVHVTATDSIRLRYIGTLDERLAKWLANEVLDGRPFTFPDMCRKYGKGGKLSDAQFKSVRADFVDRRAATMEQGRTTLLPPAYALCRHIAGRSKRVTGK
jgi:hypothetical protein